MKHLGTVPEFPGGGRDVLGWPKSSFGFLVRCFRKTRTNSWANPIFVKVLFLVAAEVDGRLRASFYCSYRSQVTIQFKRDSFLEHPC